MVLASFYGLAGTARSRPERPGSFMFPFLLFYYSLLSLAEFRRFGGEKQ